MRPRNLIAALAALAVLAATPAVASASISQELWAGGKIEQYATRYHPGYDFVATCSQEGSSYFWCDVIGDRGTCFYNGHADITVTRRIRGYISSWRWRLLSLNRTCY